MKPPTSLIEPFESNKKHCTASYHVCHDFGQEIYVHAKLHSLINRLNSNRLACFKSWLLRKDSHSTCRLQPIQKNVRNYHFVVDSKEIWQLIRFAIEISTMSITQFKCRIRLILSSSFAVLFFSFIRSCCFFPIDLLLSIICFIRILFRRQFFVFVCRKFQYKYFFFAPSVFQLWKFLSRENCSRKSHGTNRKEKRINRRAHIIVCWF